MIKSYTLINYVKKNKVNRDLAVCLLDAAEMMFKQEIDEARRGLIDFSSYGLDQSTFDALEDGKKISAIKRLRDFNSTLTLSTARDLVENFMKDRYGFTSFPAGYSR